MCVFLNQDHFDVRISQFPGQLSVRHRRRACRCCRVILLSLVDAQGDQVV
jgi:hypothetical protein